MRWNTQPKLTPALGKATSTRTGPSFDGKRRIFVVEFTGTGRDIEGLKHRRRHIGRQAVSNLVLQPNPLTKGVRASFELEPARRRRRRAAAAPDARRSSPVSETWLYRWTAS